MKKIDRRPGGGLDFLCEANRQLLFFLAGFLWALRVSLDVALSPPALAGFLRYSLLMNKRAKKRLKETIEKDKQERAKTLPQQRPGASKEPTQLRGFLPKPEKKRG